MKRLETRAGHFQQPAVQSKRKLCIESDQSSELLRLKSENEKLRDKLAESSQLSHKYHSLKDKFRRLQDHTASLKTKLQISNEDKKLLEERNQLLIDQNHELSIQKDQLLTTLQTLGHRKGVVVSIKPDTCVPIHIRRAADLEAQAQAAEQQMSEYKRRYDNDVLASRCQLELLTLKYQSLAAKVKCLRRKYHLKKQEIERFREETATKETNMAKELSTAKLFIEQLEKDKRKLLDHLTAPENRPAMPDVPSELTELKEEETETETSSEHSYEMLSFDEGDESKPISLGASKFLISNNSFDDVLLSLRNENESLRKMILEYKLTRSMSEEKEDE